MKVLRAVADPEMRTGRREMLKKDVRKTKMP